MFLKASKPNPMPIQRNRNSDSKTQILALLKTRGIAMSHKDILLATHATWDRVTIYRALDRLIEEEKIHKIVSLTGVIQYALCKECSVLEHHEHHQHVHFSCQKCEQTICLETVQPKIVLPNGFNTMEQQILLSGICNHCNMES